jgi:hypothetical protein
MKRFIALIPNRLRYAVDLVAIEARLEKKITVKLLRKAIALLKTVIIMGINFIPYAV